MTVAFFERFKVEVAGNPGLSEFEIPSGQQYSPCEYEVEGDWSGASFLLVAGAIAGSGKLKVGGLAGDSLQADRAIVDALARAGARVRASGNAVEVEPAEGLCGFEFYASDCPDLFPPLVALACACKGTTRITGAGRLAGKESDRASALAGEFGRIGGKVRVQGDVMSVEGGKLRGGIVDSHNDHRIAMACAVAGLASGRGVEVRNEECVAKSYPGFFRDIARLGARVE